MRSSLWMDSPIIAFPPNFVFFGSQGHSTSFHTLQHRAILNHDTPLDEHGHFMVSGEMNGSSILTDVVSVRLTGLSLIFQQRGDGGHQIDPAYAWSDQAWRANWDAETSPRGWGGLRWRGGWVPPRLQTWTGPGRGGHVCPSGCCGLARPRPGMDDGFPGFQHDFRAAWLV